MGLGVGTISLVLQENKDALPKLLSLEPQFCYLQNEVNISSHKFLSEVKSLSRVRLFASPWTVAYQAPPSMRFSRQECHFLPQGKFLKEMTYINKPFGKNTECLMNVIYGC